jgi:hypothetical protein
MKAEDLRIGNYVNYEQTTHKLVSINKDYCSSIWIRDKNKIKLLTNHGYKSIKPIPLTEQWLIDFGFKKSNHKWRDDSISEGIFLEYSDKGIGNYYIEITEYGFHFCEFVREYNPYYEAHHIKILKDVNQLQNLYFSLTEKELTKT